jgi:quercetin dioxygenase-like cupin family protein
MKHLLTTTALLAAVLQFGLMKSTPAHAEDGTMEISRDDERPTGPAPADYFTGEVMLKPLFSPNDVIDTSAGQVTFSPCARSAWHTHPAGQTLIVTSGTGWVQQWGGEKLQINSGDVIWTEPGVKHWHGANEAGAMTHIAVTDFVDGRNVDWMEKVSDDQYRG